SRKHARQESQVAAGPALSKRRVELDLSLEDVKAAFEKATGGASQRYLSREQERLVEAGIAERVGVLGVLTTGRGKSLAFMLPACLKGAFTTLVVVPQVSLKGNLLSKCQDLNIDSRIWEESYERCSNCALLFISAESIETKRFKTFIAHLNSEGRLD